MHEPVRVGIVLPPIEGHSHRGTGTYTDNLIESLREVAGLNIRVLRFKQVWNEAMVIHYPYFDPFFLTYPLVKKIPTTVTIHDLIPLKLPHLFPVGLKGKIKWLLQKTSLTGSAAIVTDSVSSKKDIEQFTGLIECVRVIYPGVDKSFKKISSQDELNGIRKKYSLPENFILYVGDVNANKNVIGLIKAFEKIVSRDSTLHLVLAGSGFTRESVEKGKIQNEMKQLHLENAVHILGFLKKEELVCLYNLSRVYVQPSFAEGFGLPVLEAMACGCPVVAANTTSIPEIAAGAALLVNPYKSEEIADAIFEIHNKKSFRDSLIQHGYERVEKFQWKKTAIEFYKLWKEILEKKV